MSTVFPDIPGVSFRCLPGFPGYCSGTDGSVWSSFKNTKRTPENNGWHLVKGKIDKDGYRQVILTYRINGEAKKRHARVSHVVLESFVGPCPPGMVACHVENNDPIDCRLNNLRWDTQKNNIADKVLHGTAQRGEKNANARLTADQVRTIRSLAAARELSQSHIGSIFGIKNVTVSAILHRRLWKHIE